MTNENHTPTLLRVQMPLVLLPLVALLLVILPSVAPQQASAAQVGHGLIGPLDHVVVARQIEPFRGKSGNHENDLAVDGDPDLPDWWRDDSTIAWAGLCSNTSNISAVAGHFLSATRFLIPPLRAPPLA